MVICQFCRRFKNKSWYDSTDEMCEHEGLLDEHCINCPEFLPKGGEPISPKEFKSLMQEVVVEYPHSEDEDARHMVMDRVMELTLESLGYDDGLNIYKKQDKGWMNVPF